MSAVKTKRVRRDRDTTRALILDAMEKLMVEEGYAAVSSRRIAQELGLNPATVHYHFATTDDLFVALHRRMTDQNLRDLEAVLAAENPLLALWELQSSWTKTALGVEFLALSNHRKSIQGVLSEVTHAARDAQAAVLARAAPASGIVSPLALTTMLVAIARMLANEERVGITRGHDEVRAFVSWATAHLLKDRV